MALRAYMRADQMLQAQNLVINGRARVGEIQVKWRKPSVGRETELSFFMYDWKKVDCQQTEYCGNSCEFTFVFHYWTCVYQVAYCKFSAVLVFCKLVYKCHGQCCWLFINIFGHEWENTAQAPWLALCLCVRTKICYGETQEAETVADRLSDLCCLGL